jgi:hypothetical protein
MNRRGILFWPIVVYLIFALTPAMAMPLGWLSGIMDIFWMFLGSILIYLFTKKSVMEKKRFNLLLVVVSLSLIFTKETGFLLVFSFFAMYVRRREWDIVKLISPLILGACLIYLQLNSISSFQPERLLMLYKLFFQSYDLHSVFYTIFVAYFLILLILASRNILRLRATETEEFLIYFIILAQMTFVFSGRPAQLTAYYFLPVFWALSILAVKAMGDLQIKVRYQAIAIYLFVILIGIAASTVTRSYPIGFASASEFQAKRSMTTYLFLKSTKPAKISLCEPDSSVTAALGNDSFFKLYFPSIDYGDEGSCTVQWQEEDWRFK